MNVIALSSRTSTCPLCRADVVRVLGLECSTCGAISHPDCVRELGACHETEQELPAEAEGAEEAPSEPWNIGQWAGLLVCGGVFLATMIQWVARGSSGESAVMTLIWGLIGPFALFRGWSGLCTGVVDTIAKRSNAKYSWSKEPLVFLLNVLAWLGGGVMITNTALAPLFS
jgi:hypothetical protein